MHIFIYTHLRLYTDDLGSMNEDEYEYEYGFDIGTPNTHDHSMLYL